MCLLAIYHRVLTDAPLLICAHRDEYFARPSLPPAIQSGSPSVLCGVDQRSGGTWLGVNQHGVVVAVTNRRKSAVPPNVESRGVLCRELLNLATPQQAAESAAGRIDENRYDGVNVVAANCDECHLVYGGDAPQRRTLLPGLHLISNGDLDDPDDERIALARRLLPPAAHVSVAALWPKLAAVMRRPAAIDMRESIVLRTADRGTVSSTLVVLADDPEKSVYRFADGPPDQTEYADYSQLLHTVLRGVR